MEFLIHIWNGLHIISINLGYVFLSLPFSLVIFMHLTNIRIYTIHYQKYLVSLSLFFVFLFHITL
jgi:hypothetical protein